MNWSRQESEGSSKIRSMKILQRKMDEDSRNTNEADAITYDDVVRQLFYDSARVQQMIR